MNHKQFSVSYGGNVEDYLYNSASEYNDVYGNDVNDQYNTNEDVYSDISIWKNLSFHELCAQCVLPGVWSTFNLLATNLVLCILFVICSKFKIFTESILHVICAVCGVLPIILFHDSTDFYQLLLQIVFLPIFCYIISIIFILYLKQHSAIVLSTIILLALIYRECCLNFKTWQTTKSAHMLMSMKLIAILFDYQSKELDDFPSIFQYTGYMLCAGNVFFGPFLTFQEYRNAFLFPVKWNIGKFVRLIWKIIILLICFVLSICIVDWLLNQNVFISKNSNSITHIFRNMYRQALEFRTSHYFIAYVSTVFAIICGYHYEYESEIIVTKPITIEWPRSLLHVVVHWNLPMHFWLKKYVFDEVLKYVNKNKIIAVGATYLISSLLHGLEQRLSAVLISLAAYTYVEHKMRTKLALKFPRIFSHSKNNRRRGSKNHLTVSTRNRWFSRIINIMFTILNIVHLAYLGSIMNMSTGLSSGIEYQDAFAPWIQTYFFSHIIMLIMYITSIFL